VISDDGYRCRMQNSLRFFGLVLAVAPAMVFAQGKEPLVAQPVAVPIDLATALISSGGMTSTDVPRILVGSAPEWVMPRIVVPKGAHVLGSTFQGTGMLTIVNVPLASETVIADLKAPLMEHGWKTPPVMQQSNFGGFRPAPPASSDAPITRVVLCDAGQQLNASLVRRDAKSADIAYRISASTPNSICNPPQLPMSMTSMRSPWPSLYNPAGAADARMTGDCSATLGGSQGTNTTLRTALSSDAILDHYAKQLADSGWKTQGERGVTTGRTYVHDDANGATVELSLTVTSSARAESCHDVNMTVRTLRKP
jgi:hypothetical protein